MKKPMYKRGLALILGCLLTIHTCLGEGGSIFTFDSYGYTEKAATVNTGSLNVRSGPGTTYSIVTKLSQGNAVTIIGEQTATDGALWYQLRFQGGTTGYASSAYIKQASVQYSPDANFENYLNSQGFPESYKESLRQLHAQYPNWVFKAQKTNLDWNTVIENESIIPRNLVYKNSVSSWKSTAPGAYDWDSSSWPGFDGSSWVAASPEIIKYYMDPRNFLDETYVFQFLLQSYDSSIHTKEGLVSMTNGTFLSGGTGQSSGENSNNNSGNTNSEVTSPGPGPSSGTTNTGGGEAPGSGITPGSTVGPGPQASISKKEVGRVASSYGPGMSNSGDSNNSGPNPGGSTSSPSTGSSAYIDIIMNAGANSGVNPYVLAAMILQEQGTGTSGSISGRESGYEGYYNFFNIEAYASGSLSAVQRGLWWASQSGSYNRPWNTIEKSILGGSTYYGDNYVKKGQDTFYLKKFNVQGDNLYKHQYMTNVQAAASEGAKLSKAYTSAMKQTTLEFKIPVYNNMPETSALKPSGDGSPNNKLSSLSADGLSLTPTFNRDTQSYDVIVAPSVSSITIQASAIVSSATVSGTGTVSLQSGNNDISIIVKAENGQERSYVLHVVRQDGGPVGGGNNSGSTSGPGPGGGSTAGPGNSGDSTTSPGNPSGGTIAPANPDAGGTVTPGTGSGTGPANPGGTTSPGGGSSVAGGFTIESQIVRGILLGTSASDLSQSLQGAGVGNMVKIYRPDGSENTGSVCTGDIIQGYDASGNAGSRYEASVKGDNTGDGKLNILDAMKVQRHILGLETLTGAYEKASDVNGNGKIDVMDLLKMQRDILGIEKLS